MRKCFTVKRVRPEQDLRLPTLVTILICLYAVVSCVLLLPVAGHGNEEWCSRHKMLAVGEALMVLYCLWRCVLTDPGVPPERGSPQAVQADDVEQVLGTTFCRKCEAHKLPRTHHCQYCGRCVARFDHHCDWIDNCVGKGNHKFFVLFLWHVTFVCFHYFHTLFYYVTAGASKSRVSHGRHATFYTYTPSEMWKEVSLLFFLVIYTIMAAGLLLFASTFCYITTKQLALNQTTMEADFVAGTPYNKGLYQNIKEVMGPNPLLWLIPYIHLRQAKQFGAEYL